jgi:broad specificity phosphatase PhoE
MLIPMQRAPDKSLVAAIALSIFAIAFAAGAARQARVEDNAGPVADAVTLIVVRHANKDDGSPDPGLSDAGRKRAQRLAVALRDAGVHTVYASNTARAKETASVVADDLKLDPVAVRAPYDPRKPASTLAAELSSEVPGRVVLVIGHSNTVPALLKAIGGWDVPPIKTDEDRDFDHLFVVTLRSTGEKRLICAGYPPAPVEPIVR